MRIEVNIEKKYFFGLLLIGLMVVGFVGVYAYNSVPANPSKMGHSVDEMDWSKRIAMVNATKICLGNDCREVWPSGGTANLIPGNGIIITTEAGGTRINSTATGGGAGSQWTTSGHNIYFDDGNVGIGATTPAHKLDVNGKVRGTGLCIGSDCITDLKGVSAYKVVNSHCEGYQSISFSAHCSTLACKYGGMVIKYDGHYNCAGSCGDRNAQSCDNDIAGYLVKD
jgi:hypothetical protein